MFLPVPNPSYQTVTLPPYDQYESSTVLRSPNIIMREFYKEKIIIIIIIIIKLINYKDNNNNKINKL